MEGGFKYPWSAGGVLRSQVTAVGGSTTELEVLGMKFKRQNMNGQDCRACSVLAVTDSSGDERKVQVEDIQTCQHQPHLVSPQSNGTLC